MQNESLCTNYITSCLPKKVVFQQFPLQHFSSTGLNTLKTMHDLGIIWFPKISLVFFYFIIYIHICVIYSKVVMILNYAAVHIRLEHLIKSAHLLYEFPFRKHRAH